MILKSVLWESFFYRWYWGNLEMLYMTIIIMYTIMLNTDIIP